MRTIYWDMDGTLNKFYEVENWLDYLLNDDVTPYRIAPVMHNMALLARLMNKIQKQGYQLGIISWLSKNGNEDYNARVTNIKIEWLKKHLASVQFDKIYIVPYGVAKQNFKENDNDILFDDEEKNRIAWEDNSYEPNEIFTVLKRLIAES